MNLEFLRRYVSENFDRICEYIEEFPPDKFGRFQVKVYLVDQHSPTTVKFTVYDLEPMEFMERLLAECDRQDFMFSDLFYKHDTTSGLTEETLNSIKRGLAQWLNDNGGQVVGNLKYLARNTKGDMTYNVVPVSLGDGPESILEKMIQKSIECQEELVGW